MGSIQETLSIRLVTVKGGGRQKFKTFHLQDFKRLSVPKLSSKKNFKIKRE